MRYNFVLTAMVLLSGSLAYGQESADTLAVLMMKEIVITAGRLPIPLKSTSSAVSLVNRNVLKSMPRSASADEALRLVPGVRIDNQANGSRIHMSIRGQGILSEYGLRGIRVMVDGIPINDPTGFTPDLYDIDWAVVDRIEVVRGVSASLEGGSSSAGVLNITTRGGGDKPLSAGVSSTAGSNGFRKLLVQAGGCRGKDFDFRISLSRMQGDGYRRHTAFWSNVLGEKINWTPVSGLKLTQILTGMGYFNQNAEGLNAEQVREDPRQANPDAIPFNEYQKTGRLTNGLMGQYAISENQELDFSAYHRFARYTEPGSRAVKHRDIRAPGGSMQYILNSRWKKIRNHILLGLDAQWQTVDEYKTANLKTENRAETMGSFDETVREDTVLLANQAIRQRGIGVIAVDRLDVGEKLNLTFSVRHDAIRNELADARNRVGNLSGRADFSETTARAGLVYSPANAINMYASWGRGFLPPSTEELASNPESFGGFNKNLVSAVSSGVEMGVRGGTGRDFYYDLNIFKLDTKNDFYRYRILPQRPLETFYGNVGSSRRYGIESFVTFRPFDSFLMTAAYTYSNFKYASPDSIKSNRLPNSPEHQLFAELEHEILKNLTVGIGAELQTEWTIYTDKTHKDVIQDGFHLFHAKISYRWEWSGLKWEVGLYGKNLADKSFIAFTEPDPDGNCYQPAARREFFGNFAVRF